MAHGNTHGGDPRTPEPTAADPARERPPLGSWPRLYLLCIALALVVMALLYWFTSHFNVRMPS